ncbi:FliH/SctL family protein [Paenibacillus herberti]|uniref:Flagellar assembly protein FliH n=1 Tax=Paenibacillus herberti TaxID=1619309 RepID=A0A229P170_9BACL|nr:FliH/SctL family protein [Paenibacillus herberti]OXM15983.1 flagellar assembly protein FliH [Paenibacillus herberti]
MSNLIKSSHVIPKQEHQRLERYYTRQGDGQPGELAKSTDLALRLDPELYQPRVDQATEALQKQILADAQGVADDTIADAVRRSEELLEQADQEAEQWWHARRADDEHLIQEIRSSGYEAGFQLGRQEAEAELKQQWEQRIQESAGMLESAYGMREQIIQEAEPFLIELSCSVAEKLVGKQLTLDPNIATELIRSALSRRREHGVIVLCVAPSQLAAVQAARDELELSIDSQAELQILPDASVKDHGCVIRSAFGSIDARIDTQLAEIKKELVQLAQQRDGQEAHP